MTLPDIVSVEEALRPSGEIVVPAGQTRVCGPLDEYRESYRVARVQRYEELQQLRLLPEDLDEDVATEAYRADVAAYREGQPVGRHAGRGCGCHGGGDGADTRRTRRLPRPTFSNLASAMNASRRITEPFADDIYVRRVAQAMDRYLVTVTPWLLGIVSPTSIDIEKDGVLVMSPTVWAVNTATVTLGSGSRWRFESGSVQVNCEELNGPTFVIAAAFIPIIVDLFSAKPASADMSDEEIAREQRIGKYLPGYSRERDWTSEAVS